MNFKYITTIVLVLMVLAFSRGLVLHYNEILSFGALTAFADDGGGDGGDGGGDAGGDGGDAGGDAGDGSGDAGGDAGDASGDAGGDAGDTSGDTGTGDSDTGGDSGAPACIPVEVPQTPVACSQYAGTLSGTDYGIPAGYIVGMATWTLNSCTDAVTYTGGCSAPPPPPPTAPVSNNAICLINTRTPSTVSPGQTFTAQIDVTNTGNTIWTTGAGYKLGSQNPENNTIWGTSRIALPFSPFPIGGEWGFDFSFTAPTTPGVYAFAWRMGQEGVEWFGSVCSVNITVTAPSTPPPTPIPGCTNPSATNYNPLATVNDGSCTYPPPPPPSAPVCVLSASPTAVQIGSTSSLSWTTSNATSFSINNGIGSVTPVAAGSNSVTPPLGVTTYTGTATGSGGSVTCTATITVTSAPPPPSAPVCTLIASPTTIGSGSSSTLSWTTSNATAFSIDNGIGSVTPVNVGTNSVSPTITTTYTGTATGAGGTISCSATVTITTGGGGCTSNCGGGGGGGGGSPSPNVTLAMLPHVSAQPLAYLYLSQIPYTGLELGPVGTVVYWIVLVIFSLALAYFVLFGAVPIANRSIRNFGSRVLGVLNTQELAYVVSQPASPFPVMQETKEAPRGYSSYDGFKSFARNGAISIDDIVRGLSRAHSPASSIQLPAPRVEPIYEKVEPIYENVESIVNDTVQEEIHISAPTHIRGFISALVEGDRVAVFAGLRQHVRGSGSPEKLISEVVCLLDDAYRARIDGTGCDSDVVRLTARLNTPVLEKLVTSLTTAIDSSYSAGVTGAKLALTRALTVLGA